MATGQSPFSQAQLTALTNAIALGITEVEYNGRTVRYSSLELMLSLRDRMIRELSSQADGVPRPLAHRTVHFRQ
jgi:hypothetical protein